MTRQQVDCAWKYVLAIRNADKREYGIQYLEHLRGRQRDPEPNGISMMAAQAVRMRLHAIMGYGQVSAREYRIS